MKNNEILALSNEELKERLTAEQAKRQQLVFAHSISPLENPLSIRENRKLVARLQTELRKRELSTNS